MVETLVELPDTELVKRCQARESAATQELYRRYREMVYRVAWKIVLDREDALDVTQEVFVRVLRGIGSFQQQAKVSTWMTRIAVNASIDLLRRRRRHIALHRELAETPRAEISFDTAFEAERVRAAMGKLSEEQRTCLSLREMEGQSYEEIAEALGCSIGTVRSRIHRARARVRLLLSDS
ncbi:MAG TPA: sigma-70 family RNA polymerase sigma factor [Spirochaetia bacterium]|nr:sigma-70 family RNA polymerase sigma factor [Spirochaetia bacterium]